MIREERSSSYVRRYAAAVNCRDLDAIASFYSSLSIVTIPHLDLPLIGAQASRDYWPAVFTAFPSLILHISEPVSQGDCFVAEWVMSVPMPDFPSAAGPRSPAASAEHLELFGASVVRLAADGTVMEERRYFQANLTQQMSKAGAS